VVAVAQEVSGVESLPLSFAMVRGETFTMRLTAFINGGDIDDLSDRIDLSVAGTFAHWRMKNNAVDAAVEISKISSLPAEILILPQGVGVATRGQYDALILPADTAFAPLPVGLHVFDSWIDHPTFGEHAVVRGGEMLLIREITALAVTPPPIVVGTPFPQSTQARSFRHTWTATGTSNTATIPGPMFDTGYVVSYGIEDSTVFAMLKFPSAGRTVTSFPILASGPIPIGTTIGFDVVDRP